LVPARKAGAVAVASLVAFAVAAAVDIALIRNRLMACPGLAAAALAVEIGQNPNHRTAASNYPQAAEVEEP